MAKAPRPGFSKTRLCPPLRPDQAARLSAAFLRDITENIALAARQTPIAGYVAYAPEGQEALFDGHLAAGTGLLLADGSPLMPPDVQGFGRCLLHAVLAMLARGHGSAVVLNSDSPTLPTALLAGTAAALAAEGDRVVLGPADDGGYYLLGMKAAHAHLFADIAWSTDTVAETTRTRAARLGLEVVELARWYDVDDQSSLGRLLDETAAPRVNDSRSLHCYQDTARSYQDTSTSEAGSSFAVMSGRVPAIGLPIVPAPAARTGPGRRARENAVFHAPDRRGVDSLLPYAAPFTARALAGMGLQAQRLDLAAE
jgi:rSAM/selenodomain-associated transferase 1